MSLIKKSDVKTHLSSTDTSVYPFGLKRSDVAAGADSSEAAAPAKEQGISISPSHPIAPEAVPNAQVGGSVGVPVSNETSDNRSW
jgi:hypothetical protein